MTVAPVTLDHDFFVAVDVVDVPKMGTGMFGV